MEVVFHLSLSFLKSITIDDLIYGSVSLNLLVVILHYVSFFCTLHSLAIDTMFCRY